MQARPLIGEVNRGLTRDHDAPDPRRLALPQRRDGRAARAARSPGGDEARRRWRDEYHVPTAGMMTRLTTTTPIATHASVMFPTHGIELPAIGPLS